MKVLVSFLSAVMFAAQPVFAAGVELSADQSLEQVQEYNEGAMSLFDLQAVAPDAAELQSFDASAGDVIGGIIIGGIIGLIGASIIERDGHHKWHGRNVTCFAKNKRGEVFRASGRRPRAVQARAIDKCYRFSRVCRPLGCRG